MEFATSFIHDTVQDVKAPEERPTIPGIGGFFFRRESSLPIQIIECSDPPIVESSNSAGSSEGPSLKWLQGITTAEKSVSTPAVDSGSAKTLTSALQKLGVSPQPSESSHLTPEKSLLTPAADIPTRRKPRSSSICVTSFDEEPAKPLAVNPPLVNAPILNKTLSLSFASTARHHSLADNIDHLAAIAAVAGKAKGSTESDISPPAILTEETLAIRTLPTSPVGDEQITVSTETRLGRVRSWSGGSTFQKHCKPRHRAATMSSKNPLQKPSEPRLRAATVGSRSGFKKHTMFGGDEVVQDVQHIDAVFSHSLVKR